MNHDFLHPIDHSEKRTRDPGAPSLTSTIVSLHLKLWRRSMKKGMTITTMIFVWIYGLGGTVSLGGYMLKGARHGDFSLFATTLGLGVLGYWILATLYPSAEAQLSPSWFAALPVTAKQIEKGLIFSALLQSRGLLVIVDSIITAVFGSIGLVQAGKSAYIVAWIIAVIVAGVMCIVGGEALSSFGSGFSTGARAKREKFAKISGYAVMLFIIFFNVLANTQLIPFDLLALAAAWSPFGAAGAAAGSLAEGHVGRAIIQAIIAVILIYPLWRLWRSTIAKNMVNVTQSGSGPSKPGGNALGRHGLLRGQVGALFSRQLIYYRRDPRLTYTLVTLVFSLMFLGLSAANPPMLYMAIAFVPMFYASVLGNVIGLDGPSTWVDMVVPVKPRSLFLSRILTVLVVTIPVFIIIVVVSGVLRGFSVTWALTMVAGMSASVAALGCGPMSSVYFPYPLPKPGSNPFQNGSGQSANAWIASLIVLIGVWIPIVPGLIIALVGLDQSHGAFSIWVGLGMLVMVAGGAGVAAVFYGLATSKLASSWPSILQKVKKYAS